MKGKNMKSLYKEICQEAEAALPEMIRRRRDFHKFAEMGWLEIRTSSIVADHLTGLGYEVLLGDEVCDSETRMGVPEQKLLDEQYARALKQGAILPYAEKAKDGHTGVIGILRCGEGPVIAIRCDMDALGVFEEKDVCHRPSEEGFCSVNEGMMHACGHDAHTAMGMAVAEILMKQKDMLRGTIKLIFQPAEEGVRGAKAIADKGHLRDVDYILAVHMGNTKDGEYEIGLSTGETLATTKLDVVFHGTAAHAGSHPEEGDNAMLAACSAVLNLHAIPRHGEGDTRVNVGQLVAGSGRNVICDEAKLLLEVRGSTTEANAYVEAYARRVIEAAAMMHGCTCEIKMTGCANTLWSDLEMIELCQKVCEEKLKVKAMPPIPTADASEDCSFLFDAVREHGGKGLYFKVLSPCSGAFHSRTFDFSEKELVNGVKVLCGMTLALMK